MALLVIFFFPARLLLLSTAKVEVATSLPSFLLQGLFWARIGTVRVMKLIPQGHTFLAASLQNLS